MILLNRVILAELERRLADQDRAQRVTWQTLKAELERRCP